MVGILDALTAKSGDMLNLFTAQVWSGTSEQTLSDMRSQLECFWFHVAIFWHFEEYARFQLTGGVWGKMVEDAEEILHPWLGYQILVAKSY